MRYTERIIFRTVIDEGGYNPSTGRTDPPTYSDEMLPCEISPVSGERKMHLFGVITIRAFKVRLQRPFKKHFEDVVIGGRPYEVLTKIDHDTGGGFTGLYVKEKGG